MVRTLPIHGGRFTSNDQCRRQFRCGRERRSRHRGDRRRVRCRGGRRRGIDRRVRRPVVERRPGYRHLDTRRPGVERRGQGRLISDEDHSPRHPLYPGIQDLGARVASEAGHRGHLPQDDQVGDDGENPVESPGGARSRPWDRAGRAGAYGRDGRARTVGGPDRSAPGPNRGQGRRRVAAGVGPAPRRCIRASTDSAAARGRDQRGRGPHRDRLVQCRRTRGRPGSRQR